MVNSLSKLAAFYVGTSHAVGFITSMSSSDEGGQLPTSVPSAVPTTYRILPLTSTMRGSYMSFPFNESLVGVRVSASLVGQPSSRQDFGTISSMVAGSLPSPTV